MIIFIILYDMNIVEELQVIESVKETNGCPVIGSCLLCCFCLFFPTMDARKQKSSAMVFGNLPDLMIFCEKLSM